MLLEMADKLPNRKPTRYKSYDYNLPGYYFVTICSNNMKCLFGEINNGVMVLNNFGGVVNNCWNEIPKHFSCVELNYYRLMPNHFHGILIINPPDVNIVLNAKFALCTAERNANIVGNANFAFPTDRTKMILSKIIQQFKRQVTIDIKTRLGFKGNIWQKSFYDHVIRNEKELYEIRKYIEQNPMKWDLEKSLTKNIII
jgi:putative transposase